MLLALDTSTLTCAVALYEDPVVIGEMMWRTASHHTVELAPAIADLLHRCSATPTDLKAIAVALGLQVISSTLIGALLPLGAAKMKWDPAIVASPTLTTIVDVTGLLIFFMTAKLFLGL